MFQHSHFMLHVKEDSLRTEPIKLKDKIYMQQQKLYRKLVTLFQDKKLEMVPCNKQTVLRMLPETDNSNILKSARGKNASAPSNLLSSASYFLLRFPDSENSSSIWQLELDFL